MARDRASIRIDMWADQDWRDLPGDAQRLYMQLLSHPTLNYAGVAEWRPGRLAAMTGDQTEGSIIQAGDVLTKTLFVVIDTATEEVLVRSFVKHDGLLKQPKLVVSMANSYAAVASRTIREVIAFEVQKMHSREPELSAWGVKQTETLLKAKATDARELTHGFTPAVTPALTPVLTPDFGGNAGQGLALPTATATTTSTKRKNAPSRGTRIDAQFSITDEMRKWGAANVPMVNLDMKLPEFIDYWIGTAGSNAVKTDWIAAWRNGMRKQQEFAVRDAPVAAPAKKRFVAHAD